MIGLRELRVKVTVESNESGTWFVGQGIEYDICTQARTLKGLRESFGRVLRGYFELGRFSSGQIPSIKFDYNALYF